jgi:5-methylcytosine-specific restriction protein A
MRPCAEPHCPNLVPKGRCTTHAVQQEHQRTNYDIRRLYRRAKWTHPVYGVRTQVLRRDAYTCAICRRTTLDVDVDHIIKHEGNEDKFYDMSNLQVLCRQCHSAKTAQGQ